MATKKAKKKPAPKPKPVKAESDKQALTGQAWERGESVPCVPQD